MNLTRKIVITFVLLVAAALMLDGCASSERFYEDVRMSRDAAYRLWKTRKDTQEQAQTRISGRLSIQDCLKLTLANNKTLQSVVLEKQVARGEQLKSYSAILPTIGLSGDYTRLDEVASFEVAGKTVTLGDLDNYSAGLRVTQPIFAGGSIPARINAGMLSSLLADETVRAALQNAVYAAVYAYYDVLLNQHLLEISSDAVRSADAHLQDVKQKRQAGVASNFDVLRAEVELPNFQAEFIRNKNAINVAKANLLKVMGLSQDSDFLLSDELVYVSSKVTMEQAVEAAFNNRPDLFGRELDVKYQEQLLRIARSRYWPSIDGFYANTWAKPDPHNSMDIEWGHAWQAGISATLPIFDGLAREGEILAQKARVKQAQIDLIDVEETALFELTKALLTIQDAAEFVESQRLNLTRAEEGLRLADVGYKEGTNTQVETIDAQAALTTARANYYKAIYAHLIAKLELQKAMGTLTTYEPLGSEGNKEVAILNGGNKAFEEAAIEPEQELKK